MPDIAYCLERTYMKRPSGSTYIALSELDFSWSIQEVHQIERMWDEGVPLSVMAEKLNRDLDEVAILIMDRVRLGKIKSRPGGVFGSG
jgi:hypothetical protein